MLDDGKALICPNDNIEMQPVRAESHYGQTVVLDQCPKCGGIWFDSFELYMAKQGQADKIELLDPNILRTPSIIEKPKLVCPRDQSDLVRFIDPFFPKELIIVRCSLCNGFWLNRGEFTKYQKYREQLQRPKEIIIPDDKLEQDVARILAEHKTGDYTDALGKLGKFLSTPMDSVTWRPLEPEKLSVKEETTINVILNALSIILRIFLRI
jgi:Zn-finger nucleic acid-binding protein